MCAEHTWEGSTARANGTSGAPPNRRKGTRTSGPQVALVRYAADWVRAERYSWIPARRGWVRVACSGGARPAPVWQRRLRSLIRGPSILFVALVHDAGWAETWQRSWDRLEEDYVPDRELRIRALLDVVDAIAGTAPTVLDLA